MSQPTWKKFSEDEPTKDGDYLVFYRDKYGDHYEVATWRNFRSSWCFEGEHENEIESGWYRQLPPPPSPDSA